MTVLAMSEKAAIRSVAGSPTSSMYPAVGSTQSGSAKTGT